MIKRLGIVVGIAAAIAADVLFSLWFCRDVIRDVDSTAVFILLGTPMLLCAAASIFGGLGWIGCWIITGERLDDVWRGRRIWRQTQKEECHPRDSKGRFVSIMSYPGSEEEVDRITALQELDREFPGIAGR